MRLLPRLLCCLALTSLLPAQTATPANPVPRPQLPPSMAHISYPQARRSNHTDTYFGTAVPDPYRWMEDVDSPEVRTWLEQQNTLTRSVLDQLPSRDTMKARLTALYNYERVSAPTPRGPYLFFSRNSGLQNQSILLVQNADPTGTSTGASPEARVLLDPNTLSKDGTVALSSAQLSPDGSLLAYALAEAGSDWVTWHVRTVSDSADRTDRLTFSKFSGASWLPDNSGFFYSGYGLPSNGATQPGNDPDSLKQAQFGHKVFFHRLGTPQTADTLIWQHPSDKEMLVNGEVTTDGRYLLLSSSKGNFNALFALPLAGLDLTHTPDPARILPIAPHDDAHYSPVESDGDTLWLRTTSNAPNGTLVAVDLQHPDRAGWKTVLPETRNNLDSVALLGNTFVANYLVDAQSHLETHDRSGKKLADLALPGIGTVSGLSSRRTDASLFFTFTNFTTPALVLQYTPATAAVTPWFTPKLTFNPADYETREVFVTSKDGARVPLFITGKRGLPRDGSTPTLLYAYGGFNISLQPQFSPGNLLWMELGGFYAQASLRGGGEYGEAWHQAGTKLHKQNVFDDFIASAEYLSRERYTSPAHLSIEGGSNGGLLIGAVLEQRPELFGVALAHVGVMDMLRFDQFTIGYAWRSDYGSPSAVEADFRNNLKFSPVHNVRTGTAYPPTMVFTADHDDRVFPAHSFKFTAAMQHALTEDAAATPPLTAGPCLLRVELRAGHGAGKPLSKRIDEIVDAYTFARSLTAQPHPGTQPHP